MHKLVAIVGSGPSGIFLAQELMKQMGPNVKIDIFDKHLTPFGLLRHGISPFHQKLKNKFVNTFEEVLSNSNFIGGVEIGKHLRLQELLDNYHSVALAHGANSDWELGVPGEHLFGNLPAFDFVNWYNGNPEFKDQEEYIEEVLMRAKSVAVIGQGNVAMDVAHMLVSSPSSRMETTMPTNVVKTLNRSHIQTVYLIGRRGPLQTAFSTGELNELAKISDCLVDISPIALQMIQDNDTEKEVLKKSKKWKSKAKLMKKIHTRYIEAVRNGLDQKMPTIRLVFRRSPKEIIGDKHDYVRTLVLEHNRLEYKDTADPRGAKCIKTGILETLPVEAVCRSIGYKVGDVVSEGENPLEIKKNRLVNLEGRVKGYKNLYTCGWAKRGPTGIVSTNFKCSIETAKTIISDFKTQESSEVKKGMEVVSKLLNQRNVKFGSQEAWERIRKAEEKIGRIINEKKKIDKLAKEEKKN
ncbi:adrenodoxin oxidoreductase [Anaeramoeba flamelloides]|uniref:NADPH:adrenodoxin oxidoreductase, mitochondrial n=1 Tax=Anaeramoeba flamelloides TaxID=1746091 RepID=A0ABQ8XB88_9EUKA|nr:adrenodoxin oxidoreductase [Anaeramoeba flamelloides]